MHPDRRRLVAAAAATLLTVGSGLLVGGALVRSPWLTVLGAVMLVGATGVFTLALGNPAESQRDKARSQSCSEYRDENSQ
jgi:hypothetical protein